MLAQMSPVGQIGDATVRSQYERQTPSSLASVMMQPVPGEQSAEGLHAPPSATLPTGKHSVWAGFDRKTTMQV